MKKKWLFILLGFFGLLLLLLILLPIFLRPRVEAWIVQSIDDQINGRFSTEEVDLSLFRNFPNASVGLRSPRIINEAPFEGDTLFTAEAIELRISVWELIRRGEGPRKISGFEIDNAVLNLKVDKDENANYDIFPEDSESGGTETGQDAMVFDLEAYQIKNATVLFADESNGIRFAAKGIQHTGKGQFSAGQSELITESTADLSLGSSGIQWFTDVPVRLKAILGIDLETDTYTFRQNEAYIRELPLAIQGNLAFVEEGQDWDFSFSTPDSEFRDMMALLPEQYGHYNKDFNASGAFQLTGAIKGLLNDSRIPGFDIRIGANDGYLKYAEMSRALEDLQLEMRIANETGTSADTFIEIGNATFSIGKDIVQLKARIGELLGNISIDAQAKAAMDLAQFKTAYPGASGHDLQGRVDGDIAAKFRLDDIRQGRYDKAIASGKLAISGLKYQEKEDSPPVKVDRAALTFDPVRTQVSNLEGMIGTSDFSAQGTISNLLGYLFHDEVVKGTFRLRSKKLDLNEFIVSEKDTAAENPSSGEKFEIPGFLDATISAEAQTVYYDDLELKAVTGDLIIRDKAVRLENTRSDLLGGKLQVDGMLDSKKENPEFAIQLSLQDNGIAELIEATSFFEKLAPIAKGLQGKMDSRLAISGNFSDGFDLDFSSLSGQAQTELKALRKLAGESALVRGMQQKLSFLKDADLDLKGLKTVLRFQNGRVEVSPFDFMYKDIAIRVSGSHTFDAAMDYSIALEVPAYYLGSEVNRLIAQLNDPDLQKVPVPVAVSLRGTYQEPVIQTDLTQSVSTLTARLVAIQKDKALAQGQEKASDLIGKIFESKSDTTASEKKPSVGAVLGDVLLGGSKKDSVRSAQDSASSKTPSLKETATGVLGGLLKKKKKDTVPKDSVNQ